MLSPPSRIPDHLFCHVVICLASFRYGIPCHFGLVHQVVRYATIPVVFPFVWSVARFDSSASTIPSVNRRTLSIDRGNACLATRHIILSSIWIVVTALSGSVAKLTGFTY